MAFNNRTEFTTAQASEKITLAWVEARHRILPWTLDAGTRYYKDVDYYVIDVYNTLTQLTEGSSAASLGTNEWFYDHLINRLYVDIGSDPADAEIIATYRLFFGSAPIDATHDLTDTGNFVHYDGRIQLAPPYKHKIGVQQNLVSIIGNGSLKLINNDGALDEIYDKFIFDNQQVFIYSWTRDLAFSDKRIIYRGRVTNKRFQPTNVSLQVKDQLIDLEQNVPQTPYDDTDNVTDSVKGRYKRWVYGRVDGLQLQSTDQIGEGYTITGTVSSTTPLKELTQFSSFPAGAAFTGSGVGDYFRINSADDDDQYVYWYNVDSGNSEPVLGDTFTYRQIDISSSDSASDVRTKTSDELDGDFSIVPNVDYFSAENLEFGETTDATDVNTGITIATVTQGTAPEKIIGVGTSFLSATSPGDKITVGTQEFDIEEVLSDTVLRASSTPEFSFSGLPMTLKPEIPTVVKNRDFFVADHESARVSTTVVDAKQLNRVQVADVSGIGPGDFIEFDGGQRIEVRSIFDDTIVLVQNLNTIPSVGSAVIRRPVQQVFVTDNSVLSDDYTLTNSTDTRITFDSDVEFNLAKVVTLGFTADFTNGTRSITTTDVIDLREILSPRDWIRPVDLSYTTFYEILEVKEQEVILRTPFTDPTITNEPTQGKKPEYIGDDTIVSANVLGRTEDGLAEGTWITTAAQAMRDLIREAGITNVNETSFTDGAVSNQHLISIALPLKPSDRQITYKSVVDKLARSTNSVLTLDNDLDLKYKVLNAEWPTNPLEIDDFDVIKWGIETVSGKNVRNSIVNYRFKDIDRFTQESGNKTIQFSSDFVEKYVGTDKTDEVDIYLYNDTDAEIVSHRNTYFQTLGRSDINIETDLRLEDVEIGDVIVLNFKRMYKRFGDSASRKKAAIVIGKTLNGERTKLELSDFGNILNRSSVITPNTAPDWTSATEDEKLQYGYITDQQGIVNDEEDTNGIHLIS